MKLRNREVNVFSMSALDLFASAMGAFMFLAIIALPFFPNTGDSPERIAEIKEELEETQAKLEAESKEKEEIQKELTEEKSTAKISFPTLDIVIALDTTGSMDKQVDGIKKEIVDLSELLMKLSPDAAMGIIDFKDRCEGNRALKKQEIIKLTDSSLRALQNFTNTMFAGNISDCNYDYEEAIDLAIVTASSMNWRVTSKAKTIIVVSDNGAYPEKASTTIEEARAFNSRGEKNEVAAVFVPTDQNAGGRRYLNELAAAGGGKFVTGGGSFTATILLALAE